MRDNARSISVCALVPYPSGTTPSQRYRLEQWMPYLAEDEIAVDLVPFADERLMRVLHQSGHLVSKAAALSNAFLRRAAQIASVRRYDVVFVHRTLCILGPAVLERALPIFGKPIIFDFDDAIWRLHTTRANRHFGWLKFPGKTAAICRHSTHVVVGNSFLADYARRFNPRVSIIPSSVDTDRYRPSAPHRNDRVVVGWTGSSTSQTHLELFASLLGELVKRCGVALHVHSDREPVLPGVPYVWRPWSADTEVEEIAAFDIGIMPMPDEPWARGKCAMKALLYMALGIPPVCSPVGTNCEVVEHEINGLLPATTEEWVACVQRLVNDPELRARLGAAARRLVEDRYSMIHCAGKFAEIVREVAGGVRGGLVHQTIA